MESLQIGRSINDPSVGILVFNSQLRVVAEDQGSRQLFGGTSLIGKSLFEINGSLEFDNEAIIHNRARHERLPLETRENIDDAALIVQVSASEQEQRPLLKASPWFRDEKSISDVIGSSQNLSPTRRAEKDTSIQMLSAIIRAKQEWITTVDAIADLIILEDADEHILRCNKATTSFFKLSYTEILSKSLTELFFGLQTPSLLQKYFRCENSEYQFNERGCWFEITNYAIPAEAGLSCRWVHIIKDITARKQSEAMLHQLHTIIEQVAESIIITDRDGIIQFVNATFEEITGWTQAEVIGRHFLTLGRDTTKLFFYREVRETLAEGEVWRGTYTAHRKNNTPYEEEMTISPVKDGNGNLLNYIAVSRDVTERKRLEAIAEAVNMMENVGYVVSGIRHELGNPINSIKTALSVLSNNIDHWPRAQVAEYLNRSLQEISRVEYLLRALRTFSMHENLLMQTVDLNTFIETFFQLVEDDFAKRGIRINISVPAGVGKCKADPRALHQVFLNLLANAADALEEATHPTITIRIERSQKMFRIKVIDNGQGMDETQQKSLFKPFFTSKPSGNGLGLVIVKKTMAKMNGTIDIKSKMNSGTEVSLLLEAANH